MSSVKDYSEECGRCLHCARPGCRAACPIGNDIPQFLQAVRAAEWERAADIIGHPFGEVCGYICPHEKQCQGGCVLARRDSAVRMGWVESAFFAAHPYAVRRRSDLAAGYRVAVVGGGVSGLTFAASMYSQGADVTVFERNKLLSTLSMIPSFRLPTEALDRILRQITDKFTIVRQNVDSELLCRLHEQFDMVYLATGATELYRLNVTGEQYAVSYPHFLNGTCSLEGKSVTVVGGGNTAMDCARYAVRRGASATVVYRRQRQDMPAFDKEIDAAQSEGVKFVCNVTPVALRMEHGKTVVTLAQTVSEGRGKLIVTDNTSELLCDTVVTALGASADGSLTQTATALGISMGGDVAGGKIVATAVADGLKAARTISK